MKIVNIPLSAIDTSGLGRKVSEKMVKSIAENGIIHPILITPSKEGEITFDGNTYKVIAGRSRIVNSIEAGLTEIPAEIIVADDEKQAVLSYAENNHRSRNKQTDVIAIIQLHKSGKSIDEIKELLCENENRISLAIKSFERLIPEFQDMVLSGDLTVSKMTQISRLKPDEQLQLVGLPKLTTKEISAVRKAQAANLPNSIFKIEKKDEPYLDYMLKEAAKKGDVTISVTEKGEISVKVGKGKAVKVENLMKHIEGIAND